MIPSLLFAVLLAVGTYHARLLDGGGAAGAGILTFSIAWVLGWSWLLPGAVFFLLSSALSRVGHRRKAQHDVQPSKRGPRDLVQVFANGGVAWGIVVIPVLADVSPAPWMLVAFCGAFAAAAGDTWATELGGLARRPPRHVITWRTVPAGTSGGVTLIGLGAAAAGSATVAIAGWVLGVPPFPVLLAGFAGSLIDSVLGATVQVRWTDTDGNVTESEPHGVSRRTGIRWMTNDTVNLLCTLSGGLLAIALA